MAGEMSPHELPGPSPHTRVFCSQWPRVVHADGLYVTSSSKALLISKIYHTTN